MSERDVAKRQPPPESPPVHRLAFPTDWAPGTAYAYLIDGPEPVLVDAGVAGAEAAALESELDDAGFDAGGIEHLLLTHPHNDHVGQATAAIEAADPRVYAHESVRDRLERPVGTIRECVRRNARSAGLDADRVDGIVGEAVDSARRNRGLLPPEEIDVELGHGETFEAGGFRFETIHTPGHQADHACFQLALEGGTGDVLFSGDALIESFRAVPVHVGFDAGVYDCLPAYLRAYDRLEGRDVAWVYPGHGPRFGGYAAAVERSRSEIEDVVAAVESDLRRSAPASPVALTVAREGDLEYLTDLMDTMGALGHLESNGRAGYGADPDGVRRYSPAD